MSVEHLPIASYISKRPSMTRSYRSTRKALFASPAEKRRRKLRRQRNEKRKRVLPRHMLISLTRLRGKVWTSGRLVQDLFAHRMARKCLINRQSRVQRSLCRAPGQFYLMRMKYVNCFMRATSTCAYVLDQSTASGNAPRPKGKRAMDSFLEEIKR